MKLWLYRHYKNKDYEVLWIAHDSDTLKEFVVYKALYDSEKFWSQALWVRERSIFEELIEVDWDMIPRFRYIWA